MTHFKITSIDYKETVHYEKVKIPDGTFEVRVDPKSRVVDRLQVKGRLSSGDEFLELCLLGDALKGINPLVYLELFITYNGFSRSDRRTLLGQSCGNSTVNTQLENIYDKVRVFCSHAKLQPIEWGFLKNHCRPDGYWKPTELRRNLSTLSTGRYARC